jgi:hypothetical protein
MLTIKQNRGYLLGLVEQAQQQSTEPSAMNQSQQIPSNRPSTTQNEANSPQSNFPGMTAEAAGKAKVFAPNVWVRGSDGSLSPHKICIYYDNGLLVMMFYDKDHEPNPNNLHEIKYAISKNIKKCSTNLDRNIESIYAQEDSNKLYYLNKANLAMRVNKSFLKTIDLESSRLIYEMKTLYSENGDCRMVINKSGSVWIFSKEFTSRRVFLILDGEISLAKIEEEKKRILTNDLPTILI